MLDPRASDWLRDHPEGARVALETRYRRFAEEDDGVPLGFSTPSRKIELYSETLLAHAHPPLPEYQEPLIGPVSRPDLVERYPLILTYRCEIRPAEDPADR